MEFLAEFDVDVFGAVGVVENDERRGFAFDERRFQNVLGVLDSVARVHGGIFSHVILKKPTKSPLAHLVEASWRRWCYEENVSHDFKDRLFRGDCG